MLAGILGEIDGFSTTGELRWLWERGITEGRPCGCGRPPEDCVVWAPVIARTRDRMRSGSVGPTVPQLIAAQHDVARFAARRRLLKDPQGRRLGRKSPALTQVRTAIGTACREFADVTGSRVVVDSSKRPVDAAVLADVDCVDHYVLHIVRDPRAVAHSWRRAKQFRVNGEVKTMGTRHLPASVRRWVANCLDAQVLRRTVPPSRWLEMRYEDFTRDPVAEVDRILRLLGEHGATPFRGGHTVCLRPNHMVAGNPSRFTTGLVEIRSDQAWQTEMSPIAQHSVAVATLPLLHRYGYHVTASDSGGGDLGTGH